MDEKSEKILFKNIDRAIKTFGMKEVQKVCKAAAKPEQNLSKTLAKAHKRTGALQKHIRVRAQGPKRFKPGVFIFVQSATLPEPEGSYTKSGTIDPSTYGWFVPTRHGKMINSFRSEAHRATVRSAQAIMLKGIRNLFNKIPAAP
tara:strand:+ start:890 stop:1324 length:435 start_codon:yes stop_codon:yes gene_type:complete